MCMDLINIFETIVLSSLIGSIIVLMILIIKGIFGNKLNCTFHYYIWMALLIKLIIPFGPQTPLNIYSICEKYYIQNTMNENTQKTQIKASQQLIIAVPDGLSSVNTLHSSDKSVLSNTINIPLKNKVTIKKVLCVIWMFGVILLSVILAEGHKRLVKIIRASIRGIRSSHEKILYDCMNTMNIKPL